MIEELTYGDEIPGVVCPECGGSLLLTSTGAFCDECECYVPVIGKAVVMSDDHDRRG